MQSNGQPRYMRVLRVLVLLGAATSIVVGAIYALSAPRGFKNGGEDMLWGSQDHHLRYNEARLILHGENPYQLALEGRLKARAMEVLGTDHLDPDYFPSTLLPVLLVCWLPFHVVQVLWFAANLFSMFLIYRAVCWMLEGCLPSANARLLAVCLWIYSYPVWGCLVMGQATLFSLAFTLTAFRMDIRGRPVVAGLLLALGVFKYPVVWPFVLFFFILQGRWRCLLTAGGLHLVVHLILCRIMQAHPVTIFADVLAGNGKVFNRSSLLTFWTPFRHWNTWFPDLAVPAQWLGALTLLAAVAWLARLWMRRPRDSREHLVVWTAVLAVLAVLTVYSRIYCHAYELPVLMLAGVSATSTLALRVRLVVLVLLLCQGYNSHLAGMVPTVLVPWLHLLSNTLLFLLALELGWLVFRLERASNQRTV
ncbi:MAG: DUF2029 domain-containing protein [Verrucomicrobiaceae bacterium]|nr:DUF2029 domain-containing protein [Verrucomicrobiaceae bacterium]